VDDPELARRQLRPSGLKDLEVRPIGSACSTTATGRGRQYPHRPSNRAAITMTCHIYLGRASIYVLDSRPRVIEEGETATCPVQIEQRRFMDCPKERRKCWPRAKALCRRFAAA